MQTIKLNMIPNGSAPVCYSSQYDVDRTIKIELFDGNTPFELSANDVITLNARKPDNTIFTDTLTNTESNYVYIYTTEQLCAVDGSILCEITIERSGAVISSLNFILNCEVSPLKNGIESESEIRNLATQVAEFVAVEVADQYDSQNVIFDTTPTAGHNAPYTITSAAIKNIIDNFHPATDAASVSYDNDESGITADNVQGAIDEIIGEMPTTAADIAYINSESGLTADNTQDAIDELTADVNNKADITSLAAVATSGSYNDLSNKPALKTVATTGNYNDLTNKPTIPTVNNAALTIQKNGATVATFTANQSTAATANITVPTNATEINYSSGVTVKAKIDTKADSSSLATVATSGSYNDLSNKPTIPQNVFVYAEGERQVGTWGNLGVYEQILTIIDGTVGQEQHIDISSWGIADVIKMTAMVNRIAGNKEFKYPLPFYESANTNGWCRWNSTDKTLDYLVNVEASTVKRFVVVYTK